MSLTPDLSAEAQIGQVRACLGALDKALRSAVACGLTVRLEVHENHHNTNNRQLRYQAVRVKEAFVPL